MELSDTNRLIGLPKEGIRPAEEALEIYERLGVVVEQAQCLLRLAYLLHDDKRLDDAEKAASRAIDLLPEEGQQFKVCESHRILGMIYRSKGETEKAIHHLEIDLGIATPFNWHDHLFWAHYELVEPFLHERRFDDAEAHIERTKPHAVNNAYALDGVMVLQAALWYRQGRLEEAGSELLRAAELFERLGAASDWRYAGNFSRVWKESKRSGCLWSIASSYGRFCFLRVLTFHSKLGELNGGISGYIKFFKSALPKVTSTLSFRGAFPPSSSMSLLFFLFKNVLSTHAHRFLSVVLPPAVTSLPLVLSLSPSLSLFYIHTCISRVFWDNPMICFERVTIAVRAFTLAISWHSL